MQGEALFEAKKRLSRLKKGVSLILLKSLPKPLRRRGCVPPSASFYLKEPPLQVKRAFPCNEKGVPSH